MSKGLRQDLIDRLKHCFAQGLCAVPESPSDGHRLRAALRAGHVASPFPQLYVLPDQWATLDRTAQEHVKIRSLAALHPDWVFSDISAAIVHGLAVTHSLMSSIHIVTGRTAHSRSSRLVTRHAYAGCQTVVVDGIRVTTLERSTFDCLRRLSFRTALPIADSALRVLGTDQGHFIDAFGAYHAGTPHHRRAIEIMGLANGLSESGGESVARAVIIEQGYLLPELQVEVASVVDPDTRYRVDFCWDLPSGKIYGELDGREKYQNPAMTQGKDAINVLADERLRESYISGNGIRMLRFGYRDVVHEERFRQLLDAYDVPSGYVVPEVARPDSPLNGMA